MRLLLRIQYSVVVGLVLLKWFQAHINESEVSCSLITAWGKRLHPWSLWESLKMCWFLFFVFGFWWKKKVNQKPRKDIKTLKLQNTCGPVLSATLCYPQQVVKSRLLRGTEVRLSGEIIMLITNTRQFKKLKRLRLKPIQSFNILCIVP